MSQSGVTVRGIVGGIWQGACRTGAAMGRGFSLLWQVARRLLRADRSRPPGGAARQSRREERRRRKQLRREAERARAVGRSSLRKAA
jgi:hypothetical protein